MTKPAGRWLDAFGVPALVCALLTFGTGCGALKAAANPKVAWALNDPAPMSVVVRRADVAEKTSKEVDRLMTDTPANDDSPWLTKVAPDKEAATKDMTDLKTHDLYVAGARVVAAEAWAKELAQVEPKNAAAAKPATVAAAAPAAAATPAAAAPAAPATPAVASTEPTEPAAPAAKEAKGGKKKGKGGKGGGDKTASAAKKDKKGGKKAAKEKASEAKSEEPTSTTTTTAAVVPAATPSSSSATPTPTPAPDAAVPAAPAPAKYTSLLAAIDPSLGTEWAKVMEKKKAMGDAKSQIAVLEAANDQKGISEADKKANKTKISELEKSVDAFEKDADKLSKEFIPKAKAAASKAAPEVRERFGPALVNLRQAVDDANISNSAAAIRYPLAATTLLDSAKQMAKVYVGDVIEEKTGKRPSTQALEPGVTMEGGKVQVTLNGLSGSDMGKLSVGDVTTEVAARTTAWAKRALGLLGVISATKDVLSFEEDVLVNLIEGFTSAGWKAPAAATIPEPPPGPGAQPRS